ncbi:MAG: hypothetical protein V1735_04155 [Nanoarchaeota archaeon]
MAHFLDHALDCGLEGFHPYRLVDKRERELVIITLPGSISNQDFPGAMVEDGLLVFQEAIPCHPIFSPTANRNRCQIIGSGRDRYCIGNEKV